MKLTCVERVVTHFRRSWCGFCIYKRRPNDLLIYRFWFTNQCSLQIISQLQILKGMGLGDTAQWEATRSNELLELYDPFFLRVNYATGLQTMTFECADCLGGSLHVYVMEKDDLLDRGTL